MNLRSSQGSAITPTTEAAFVALVFAQEVAPTDGSIGSVLRCISDHTEAGNGDSLTAFGGAHRLQSAACVNLKSTDCSFG